MSKNQIPKSAPLTKESSNKFKNDVNELIDIIKEMKDYTFQKENNYPHYSFLNKMISYARIATDIFNKEYENVKSREELDETEGDIDEITDFSEYEVKFGSEQIEILNQKSLYELSTVTKSKNYICHKQNCHSQSIEVV